MKAQGPGPLNPTPWPDPTPEMLASAAFEAVWQKIKRWDINVPDVYAGHMGATGNHVRAILDALVAAGVKLEPGTDPLEAKRRAGVGNKTAAVPVAVQNDPDPAWKAAYDRNKTKAEEERVVALREVTDVAMANEFLLAMAEDYANYSQVELKLVDPRCVTHIRPNQKQKLSEVIDAPAAIAVIVTRKNHTETPYYIPLKCNPSPGQLSAIKDHVAARLGGARIAGLLGD